MIEPRYSTFWRRFWAGWVDTLVFLPLTFGNIWVWNHVDDMPLPVLVLWHMLFSTLWLAYSIGMHGRYGQTLGKMALKVKVVDVSEERAITYKQAVLRDIGIVLMTAVALPYDVHLLITGEHYLLHPHQMPDPISMLLSMVLMGWMLLEVVTMLFSSKRRAVHDFIAGSVVVNLTVPTGTAKS